MRKLLTTILTAALISSAFASTSVLLNKVDDEIKTNFGLYRHSYEYTVKFSLKCFLSLLLDMEVVVIKVVGDFS